VKHLASNFCTLTHLVPGVAPLDGKKEHMMLMMMMMATRTTMTTTTTMMMMAMIVMMTMTMTMMMLSTTQNMRSQKGSQKRTQKCELSVNLFGAGGGVYHHS